MIVQLCRIKYLLEPGYDVITDSGLQMKQDLPFHSFSLFVQPGTYINSQLTGTENEKAKIITI